MILRLILIILAIWIAYSAIKYLKKLGRKPAAPQNDPTLMVQCKYCGTHVPTGDAVHTESGTYCNSEHAEKHQSH